MEQSAEPPLIYFPNRKEVLMATTKSTTTAVPANAVDRFFGNVGEGGEKLENGQPVTETVTETEDKEEEKKD
jgi:hypothetical protein